MKKQEINQHHDQSLKVQNVFLTIKEYLNC